MRACWWLFGWGLRADPPEGYSVGGGFCFGGLGVCALDIRRIKFVGFRLYIILCKDGLIIKVTSDFFIKDITRRPLDLIFFVFKTELIM